MSVTTLQGWLLVATGALLLLIIISDYLRHKVDLLSIRNILIIGFLIYQIVSPAAVLFSQNTDSFRIGDLAYAGWQFIGLSILFLLVFFLVYRWGWFTKRMAHHLPIPTKEMSEGVMVVAAVAFSAVAVLARLVPPLPAVAYALFFIALGSATTSTGLVTWWWMRRPYNFSRISLTTITISINLLVVVSGAFSRRPIIAIMLMFAWAVYYARARYMVNRAKVLVSIGFATLPVIILASLFTAARVQENREANSFEIAKIMFVEGSLSEKLSNGFVDLMGGQLVGEASLWCNESFPEHIQQDHLLSLRYYFLANIPRDLWPGKPWVLSARVADLADIQGVRQDRASGGRGITMPPGVIGYIAAEGGWYAAIIYAFILGLLARFLDELVVVHAYRVAVVIPVAASLGNVLGLLRGDLALFALGATWAILASFVLIYIAASLLGHRTYQTQTHAIR